MVVIAVLNCKDGAFELADFGFRQALQCIRRLQAYDENQISNPSEGFAEAWWHLRECVLEQRLRQFRVIRAIRGQKSNGADSAAHGLDANAPGFDGQGAGFAFAKFAHGK